MNFYHIFITGLIGALIINSLTYLFILLGVNTSTPWDIAASVFLNEALVHTLAGLILGIIGTIALSTATSLLISYVLSTTGFEFSSIKGLFCSNALGFINLGLFMKALNIWPQIRNEPATNYVALIFLSVLGIVQALLLKRWSKSELS